MKDLGGLKKLVYFVTDTKPTEEEVAASAKDKGKKKGSAKKKGKADDKKGGNAAGEEEDESIPSVMLPEAKIQSCRGLARCAKNGTFIFSLLPFSSLPLLGMQLVSQLKV